MTNNSAPPLVVTRGNDNGYEPGSMVITHVQASGLDIIQYIPGRSSYGTPPFVPPGPSPYVGPGMQEYRRLRDTLDKSHSELKKNLKNKTLKEVDELKSEAGLPVKAVSANDIRNEKSIVDALMDAKAKSLKAIEDRPANLYTASDFPQKSEAMYQNQLLASRKFYGEFLDRHMSELAKAYSADIYKAQIAILKQTSQALESKARSMEAQAQQVTQQLGADFNAITTPTATKVQQRVKAVDASLSQVSTQVSGAVASATQAVQVKTAQAQQQANSQISSSQNLISAAFPESDCLGSTGQWRSPGHGFQHQSQADRQRSHGVFDSTKTSAGSVCCQCGRRGQNRGQQANRPGQGKPTKAASQAAQATLRQFTESTYAKVNTYAQQTEAELQAKAKEVSAAVAEAQRAATNDLQKQPM